MENRKAQFSGDEIDAGQLEDSVRQDVVISDVLYANKGA